MLFSVVICTHNRRDFLLGAVESTLQQTLSSPVYEIVVVDNCSTDGTAEAIQRLTQEHPTLRYIYETNLGLATARNTGWRSAHGQYVAFLDDDARAAPDWLATAAATLQDSDAWTHCVGGPIHPFYTDPQPAWWKDQYEIRTRGNAPRLLRQGEFFSGSNMIWRKDILEKYGGFATHAGMKGTTLGMGEETHLFRAIWEQEESPRFVYAPNLMVYHWVPKEKMEMRYIVKRALAQGKFEAEYALGQIKGDFTRRVGSIFATTLTLSRQIAAVTLRRRHYLTTQNWFFENCFEPIQNAGKLIRLMGLKVVFAQRK
jgi:glycosyltransferase involved in cell wall biosynthesis